MSSYLAFPPLHRRSDAVSLCCTFLGVASTGRYPAPCPMVLGLSSSGETRMRPFSLLTFLTKVFRGVLQEFSTLLLFPHFEVLHGDPACAPSGFFQNAARLPAALSSAAFPRRTQFKRRNGLLSQARRPVRFFDNGKTAAQDSVPVCFRPSPSLRCVFALLFLSPAGLSSAAALAPVFSAPARFPSAYSAGFSSSFLT